MSHMKQWRTIITTKITKDGTKRLILSMMEHRTMMKKRLKMRWTRS
jgi:hypothetical protein